jgi:hypothetical protein
MGKSKKIIFNLTIDDLRELGIIGKKRRKGRKGRNKKRILLIDPQTGTIIGEPKSDSSHMIGTTQTLQPSNTNSINTAIQQANLEAIENAKKRAKDQRQWLIDNGIDPNDPTIGLQSQERFPDRNTTKLLEGFGASVSDQLGQMKSQYDNQLLGYQDRFANYDKTINRGMEFVQQQAYQMQLMMQQQQMQFYAMNNVVIPMPTAPPYQQQQIYSQQQQQQNLPQNIPILNPLQVPGSLIQPNYQQIPIQTQHQPHQQQQQQQFYKQEHDLEPTSPTSGDPTI